MAAACGAASGHAEKGGLMQFKQIEITQL